MISNRYSKANKPYFSDHNPDQESKYIVYVDANNLYMGMQCLSIYCRRVLDGFLKKRLMN